MGSFSAMHWVIVLLVFLILFGGGRISGLMGDIGLGIKSFRKGLADEPAARSETVAGSSSRPLIGHGTPNPGAEHSKTVSD